MRVTLNLARPTAFKHAILFILIVCLLQVQSSEGRRSGRRSRGRRVHSPKQEGRHHRTFASRTRKNFVRQEPRKLREIKSISELKNYQFSPPNQGSNRYRNDVNIRTEVIKDAILTMPSLSQLLEPIKRHGNLDGLVSESHNMRLQGTVRTKRLYCRVGIGYHLEITKSGKIVANHAATPNSVMKIFSVETGVVGIRSQLRKRYLCMNKAGKVFTRKSFRPDCEFRENVEDNNFNTYASERYSNHTTRKGYYLSITRKGKIPKRMKKVSWKQKRAHWLPRDV